MLGAVDCVTEASGDGSTGRIWRLVVFALWEYEDRFEDGSDADGA
jgi:hypothetical protein